MEASGWDGKIIPNSTYRRSPNMFAFLPLISLIVLYGIFHQKGSCWRSSILSAAIVWGLLLTAITEILSFGKLITFAWLLGVWALIDIGLIYIYFKLIKKRERMVNQKTTPNLPSFSILLLCGVAFIVSMIGLTALIAAPNNWDSMNYHMARVVHWIQNHSVAYYATSYLPQLYQKPWAEFTIMHFQILSGSDYFANLVQWFCMLGSIIGVSLIAEQLGANLRGQILSSVICASIPMGILQGSSTQNDYVVSFWLVCFVYYVLLALQVRKISAYLTFQIGASLGLAFFAKGTAYIYTFPFFIWFLFSGIKRFRWKLWKPILGIFFLVFAINLSHEIRNIDLFGYPLASGSEKYTNEVITISVFFSNIIRNISLHIYIPISILRSAIEGLIGLVHSLLGIGVSDPHTTWPGTEFHLREWLPYSNFHEDTAPNTLHLLLILGAITLFLTEKKRLEKNCLSYLIAVISCFFIFCILLKWQPWHSRLHLPIFVLFSPFIARVLSKLSNHKITNSIAIVLVLLSLLWVFCNASRPLIFPINNKLIPMSYENIFNTSRVEQYFNNQPKLREPYIGATNFLKSQECSKVGLSLISDDWEYPFWMLLHENRIKKYQIEQVNVKNVSLEKSHVYPHDDFLPCAIIAVRNAESYQSDSRYIKVWSKDLISVFLKKE